MTRARLGRRILGAALVLAAFAFLVLAVARDWRELRAYDWHVDPLLLALSLIALLADFAIGVYGWHRTLRCFETEAVRYGVVLRIWFISTLARYIPGKIWQFVGAAQLAKDEGLPAVVVLTSLVVNMGFTLLAAALVGLATVPVRLAAWTGDATAAVLVAITGLAVLAVHPAVLNFLLRLMPRWLHRSVLVWKGRWWDGIVLLAIAAASWLVYGAALLVFFSSLVRTAPPDAYIILTGANALAFLAGYFIIIAPAGLGAREVSFAALLTPVLPTAVAAVLAVASRLWIVATELLGAGIVISLHRLRRPRNVARPSG